MNLILSHGKSILGVIVTFIVVIALNLFVSQYAVTYDLTDHKIFTLSPASIKAVKGLKEEIVIKAYISPDMPPPLHLLAQNVDDLLSDYAAASKGKLSYEIIHAAANDATIEKEAKEYGIEKVGIGQRTDNEVSLRAVYKGLVFIKGEKREIIHDLRTSGNAEIDNFEYEFTKAILNLESESALKVGFLGGFGGPAANPQFLNILEPMFTGLYGKLIEISLVDLSQNGQIPEDLGALIILNIENTVSENAKFALDQYLQGGGSIGWYQSASAPDVEMIRKLAAQLGAQNALPDVRKNLDTGLNAFFATMGLNLRQDTVLDRERGLATSQIRTKNGFAQVSHPASFLLEDLDRSLPFVAVLPGLVLPAPSTIEISEKLRQNKAIETFEIARTPTSSIRRPKAPETLNYERFMTIGRQEEAGPFVVAAALRGELPSYYEDNSLPPGIDESQLRKKAPASARLLIVGNGDFFLPNPQVGFSNQFAGLGAQFLLSSIEWLVQNGDLSEIRGKKAPRLLGEIPKSAQRKIQFANIVAVPALFSLFGVLIMRTRRRRRESFKL